MALHARKDRKVSGAVKTLSTLFLAAAGMMGCGPTVEPPTTNYSDFVDHVEKKQVKAVTLEGNKVTVTEQTYNPTPRRDVTYLPQNENPMPMLKAAKVRTTTMPEPKSSPADTLLPLGLLTAAFLVGSYIVQKKLMGAASKGGGPGGIGKSRANRMEKTVTSRLADVAGMDEVKDEVEEIIDFLKDPKKYQKLGGRIPKGVLLDGPPGTGKTLLARAMAGEAGVPFFSTSGADFVEMFVGVGAARVRDLFAEAKKNAPSIIFIDEIDAVARKRGGGLSGGHDEREQTLNALLVEMDGFGGSEGVIVLAATNRTDVLDDALKRPGRFDRKVSVPRPDVNGRYEILKIHARKVPLDTDVSLLEIAQKTPGFVGADLENIVNEAALRATRMNADKASHDHFLYAIEKVLMGPERKGVAMSAEEKHIVCAHEAGHAILGYRLEQEGLNPLSKISMIPRGSALGVTVNMPQEDKHLNNARELKARLIMTAGGRIGEEMLSGDAANISSGASDDIDKMTNYATQMVMKLNMSGDPTVAGMRAYAVNDEDRMRGMVDPPPEKKKLLDAAIDKLLNDAVEKGRAMLKEDVKAWVRLTDALLKYETLDRSDIIKVIENEPISPVKRPDPPPRAKAVETARVIKPWVPHP